MVHMKIFYEFNEFESLMLLFSLNQVGVYVLRPQNSEEDQYYGNTLTTIGKNTYYGSQWGLRSV